MAGAIRVATILLAGVIATAAHGSSSPVRTETASSGSVRATITYSIPRGGAYFVVRLTVDRAGRRALDVRVPECTVIQYCGTKPVPIHGGKALAVSDLDDDGEPEILLDLWSGGVHCCWWSRLYRWNASARRYVTRAHLWGNVAYRLADLDQDRKVEFVSSDDRFAYAFTSFARSSFPLQIWTYHAGRLVDTTRAYRTLVARDARKQWRWYRRDIPSGEVRGYLAAWAADQCLLGRCQAAFARLRRLSPTFSDPTDVAHSGSAASYLRHLRSLLRRTGYWRSESRSR